jgi:GTP-binding protein
MINHFEISSTIGQGKRGESWYLVDLPGYGFAKVSQRARRRWEQMIENYLRKRENLSMVFVLIDARHSPQKIDLEFLDRCKNWSIPCSIIFTKSDKENQQTVAKNTKAFLEAMRKTWMFLPKQIVTSAVKKTGKDKLLEYIGELLEDLDAS